MGSEDVEKLELESTIGFAGKQFKKYSNRFGFYSLINYAKKVAKHGMTESGAVSFYRKSAVLCYKRLTGTMRMEGKQSVVSANVFLKKIVQHE